MLDENDLIKKASESIGLQYKGSVGGRHIVYNSINNWQYEWNPLKNKEDAFDLIVGRNISFEIRVEDDKYIVVACNKEFSVEEKTTTLAIQELEEATMVAITKLCAK